jgi:hypothetical protein
METIEQVVAKSPLIEPENLLLKQRHELTGYEMDWLHSTEFQTEDEITENNAERATIENILTLFLSGAAPGLVLSPAGTPARLAEVGRLLKWLRLKLFTQVNNQTFRANYIRLVDSFPSSAILSAGVLKFLINNIFDFKNRVVANAVNEYSTWLTTRVNGTYAIKEYDTGALSLLTKYWNATPTPPSPITSGIMWSAAFISWLVKESGAAELFQYSGAHITYIRAARRNRRDSLLNPFRLYRISEFIPRMQPGDLLCKARDSSGLTFDNVLTHRETSAHVDIVTEIDIPNNRIRVIGGNVCDNVDHKGLNIVGDNRITNSDGDPYFAGIGIGFG